MISKCARLLARDPTIGRIEKSLAPRTKRPEAEAAASELVSDSDNFATCLCCRRVFAMGVHAGTNDSQCLEVALSEIALNESQFER